MHFSRIASQTFVVLVVSQLVDAAPHPGLHITRDDQLLKSYDFIIVGGGTGGLALARRLTEKATTHVLVLEAGPYPSAEDKAIMDIPFFHNQAGWKYDWNILSEPHENLNGIVTPVNTTKAIGGASQRNGMFWNRGSKSDHNAWEELGNPGWGWNDVLPYFKKSVLDLEPLRTGSQGPSN